MWAKGAYTKCWGSAEGAASGMPPPGLSGIHKGGDLWVERGTKNFPEAKREGVLGRVTGISKDIEV